jgi:hypothetical protein
MFSEDYSNQCGIIYCITQKNCVELADFFVKFGFAATYLSRWSRGRDTKSPSRELDVRQSQCLLCNYCNSYCEFISNFFKLEMSANNLLSKMFIFI